MKRSIFIRAAFAAICLPIGAVIAQSDGTEKIKPPVGQDVHNQQSSQESATTTGTSALPTPATSGTLGISGTAPQTSGTDPIIPVPHMAK